MIIPDRRYERIRHVLVSELARAVEAMSMASKEENTLAFESAQDDADEWSLLIQEFDDAAPEELRSELGIGTASNIFSA
jgi:hypothetical protein